jgi:hypothetical protein
LPCWVDFDTIDENKIDKVIIIMRQRNNDVYQRGQIYQDLKNKLQQARNENRKMLLN